MRGRLHNLIGGFVGSGVAGGRGAVRSFHSFRSLLLSGQAKPRDDEEGRNTVTKVLDQAEEANFLETEPGVLKIITLPEFGLNGHEDDVGNWVYNAQEPLHHNVFQAVASELQDRLRELPPGIVVCMGTGAIDCGDGIGENRGVMVSSGSDSDVLEFTKGSQSGIDGWDAGFTVRGEGLAVFKVTDILGTGWTRYIGVAVCLDYKKAIQEGRITFPMMVDLILCPAAAWPGGVIEQNVDVIVNDAIHNPFEKELSHEGYDRTSVWTPTMKNPFLKDVISMMVDGGPTGSPILTGLGMLVLDWPTMQQYLEPKRVMSLQPYEYIRFTRGGGEGVDTGIRVLPEPMTDKGMLTVARATTDDEATIISGGEGQNIVKETADAITKASAQLPWDYIREKVETVIDDHVVEALRKGRGPIATSVDDLVMEFAPDAATQGAARLTKLAWESAVGNPDLSKMLGSIDDTSAKWLVDQVVTEPIKDRMRSTVDGSSWVEEVVRRSVLDQKAHALAQKASEIQAHISETSKTLETTETELSSQRAALEKIRQELKNDPNNSTLKQSSQNLDKELEHLERQQRQADAAKEKADAEKSENSADTEETDADRRKASEAADHRGSEVFHGE